MGYTEGVGRAMGLYRGGEKGGGLYRGGGKGEVSLRGARRAVGYTEGAGRAVGYTEGWEGRGASAQREGCSTGPQVRGKAVLKSLWKNLERGGIKWKNIPNFVTKRERR